MTATATLVAPKAPRSTLRSPAGAKRSTSMSSASSPCC